jgi:hypothetical protein
METIRVVLDKKPLQEAERAARRAKTNYSVLVLENRDREGYSKPPEVADEWEGEAAWPER